MKQTYENAMRRLNEIATQLENNDLGIDDLSTLLKESNKLVEFCKEKLYQVENDCAQLQAED